MYRQKYHSLHQQADRLVKSFVPDVVHRSPLTTNSPAPLPTFAESFERQQRHREVLGVVGGSLRRSSGPSCRRCWRRSSDFDATFSNIYRSDKSSSWLQTIPGHFVQKRARIGLRTDPDGPVGPYRYDEQSRHDLAAEHHRDGTIQIITVKFSVERPSGSLLKDDSVHQVVPPIPQEVHPFAEKRSH